MPGTPRIFQTRTSLNKVVLPAKFPKIQIPKGIVRQFDACNFVCRKREGLRSRGSIPSVWSSLNSEAVTARNFEHHKCEKLRPGPYTEGMGCGRAAKLRLRRNPTTKQAARFQRVGQLFRFPKILYSIFRFPIGIVRQFMLISSSKCHFGNFSDFCRKYNIRNAGRYSLTSPDLRTFGDNRYMRAKRFGDDVQKQTTCKVGGFTKE